MNRKFTLVITAIIISLCSSAQSISPNENNEFCPNVDVTFTVTLPIIASNTTPTIVSYTNNPTLVSGISNLTHTQTQTTFTFVGRFRDVNINQVFKIDYTPNGGSATFYLAQFKKTKSLYYSTSCAKVSNQPTITVPRCQIINIPISFSNVQWGTAFESPELCFGTITDYEYQLPAGWSLNGQTSTGSNWISGSNNVTVTSDASNGVNGMILVRPRNSCGSGLSNGQVPGQIPISRPAPTFSITGAQAVCSGSSTYTLSGVPAGATVSWALSNTTHASISNPGTTVDVTRIGSLNTTVVLSATVTDCVQTYRAVSKTIVLGKPSVLAGSTPLQYWNGNASTDYNDACNLQTTYTDLNIAGATSVAWSRIAASPTNTNWSQNGNNINFYFWSVGQTAVFRVEASNGCGTTTNDFGFKSINCGGGGGCELYNVSPNPASGSIKVTASNIPPPCPIETVSKTKEGKPNVTIKEIRLYDNLGNIKQVRKEKGTKQVSLNISGYKPGVYFIEIVDGNYKERKQIIIQ